MKVLTNPLLPGFYPDPSVCRKGEDYYLVTSSFEYFPGIPIFHSRDFVHWHQIGHCLTRPQQLNLDHIKPSKGIYASAIRYREQDGLFYISSTLVKDPPYYGNINFYITAKDPAGPWSDPVIIQGAESIDPTLFFDGDRTYYLGNLRPFPQELSREERSIWLQEMDLPSGRLIGQRWILRTDGALHGAVAPEGPHLYKIGGWYYLMIAEGGTDHNHSVTIFRSRQIEGPYEVNPRNPVLTHRNLRRDYPINSTGHADLIQLSNGEWWAVLLASRPDGGDYRNLGRETFAVPVIWEDEWPVFSPDTGHVEFTYPAPALPVCRWEEAPACDSFESSTLDLRWNLLRTPRREVYSLTQRPGWLRLFLSPFRLTDLENPAFIGRRQQHLSFAARLMMAFVPAEGEAAGLAMLMNHEYHLALLRGQENGEGHVSLWRCFAGKSECLGRIPCEATHLWLRVTAYEQDYSFYMATEPEHWQPVCEHVCGTLLSKEVAGGFTGTYIGLYATSNHQPTTNYADFDWFEYQPLVP